MVRRPDRVSRKCRASLSEGPSRSVAFVFVALVVGHNLRWGQSDFREWAAISGKTIFPKRSPLRSNQVVW